MKQKTAFIVSTTHWDREWYWAKERFRIRLVQLIDDLIEIFESEPRYKFYMMDGQTIPLEDYLEIKPEKRKILKELVKEGRLLIGPWYILPDDFLVSGESLIRNLLIGHKTAADFGGVMDVGYLPDSFSHIDQIPQIMKGFNFNEFLFMRGMGKEFEKIGTEFWWEAPDGSKVFTTYLIEGYFNAGGLGFPDAFIDFRYQKPDLNLAEQKMNEMLIKMCAQYKSDVYLLFNGSDHTDPQKELPEILEYLNEKNPDVYFKHATLREYLDSCYPEKRELQTYKGEFTGNIHHLIVRSVYSTRIYLKQKNFFCQNLLEKYVEPISSFSYFECLNDFRANLEYAWKTLLKNHPHDSISGCSIDSVHREMLNRYEKVEQIGEYIQTKSVMNFASKINTSLIEGEPVLVYNPMNWERNEVVRAKVLIPRESPLIESQSFSLVDFEGRAIPFTILESSEEYIAELNNWKKYTCLELEFNAHVPSIGYSVYYLQNHKSVSFKTKLKTSKNTLENEYYKISVNKNGSLKILNKTTKETFNNFNLFEDTEDDGDEYTYSFVENSRTYLTLQSIAKTDLSEKNLLSATLKIEIDFKLPESLEASRTKRSKKLINNKIVSFVTLYSGSEIIDIKTEIVNNSKDHRLRVLFPTKFKEYSNFADGHFNVVERPKYFPEKPNEREKIEYYSTQHESNFVTLTNGKSGVSIANKGLPEYEILKEDSTIAVTLLRCVGWLNKNNLMTRWRMAGPDLETSEAQCAGRNIFEYSVILHKKSWENSYKNAFNYCYPLYSQSIKRNSGELSDSRSLIDVSSDELVVSAVKVSEKKDGLVVRFYNIKPHEVRSTLSFYRELKKCHLTDFLENELEELNLDENKIDLIVPNNKIITIKLIF